MVRRCRRDPTDAGLVTGLGWYSTKHSVGVWSASPPPAGWRLIDTAVEQAHIDSSRLAVAGVGEATGRATVDGYTVVYDRDGRPRWTPIIAHLSDGRRVVARSDDPQIAEAMGGEMYVGKTVCLRNTGSFTGFELS
ncbi:acetyl-CoA acetyltransferase [Mycobacteroides abscessus subsp. abscessus]|nr:acetyl-CoA acetyltransferase [Mycobacteroides abscessus subsp. abscessus]